MKRRNLNRRTPGLSTRPGAAYCPGRPAGWISSPAPTPRAWPELDRVTSALKSAGVPFRLKRCLDGVRLDIAPGHEAIAAMVMGRLGARTSPSAPPSASARHREGLG